MAAVWREHGPRLALLNRSRVETGLHFDLTCTPLLKESARALSSLLLSAYSGGLDAARLRTQVRAQLDAF